MKPKYYCRFGFSLKFYTRNNLNMPEYIGCFRSRDFACESVYPVLRCRSKVFASLLHTQLAECNLTSGLVSPLAQNFKANPNFQSNFTFDNFFMVLFLDYIHFVPKIEQTSQNRLL